MAGPAERDAACLAGARAADARIVGKVNLHELAVLPLGTNPWFGTPVNPLDPALIPGGSSSGSAVAVEARESRVEAARALGADEVLLAGDGLSRRLREAVGDDGADAVLDFVGTDQTLNAALRNAAKMGSVALVGQGFGTAQVRYGQPAHDCDVFNPQGATIAELHEVVALAQTGKVTVEVEQFAFDDVAAAYERLRAGTLNGRAVVLP
jgi:propanol-preferring alcohol dehydrogenase